MAAAAPIFQGRGSGLANRCPVDSEFGLGEVEDPRGGWWWPLCLSEAIYAQCHGTEHFKVMKLVTAIMDIWSHTKK